MNDFLSYVIFHCVIQQWAIKYWTDATHALEWQITRKSTACWIDTDWNGYWDVCFTDIYDKFNITICTIITQIIAVIYDLIKFWLKRILAAKSKINFRIVIHCPLPKNCFCNEQNVDCGIFCNRLLTGLPTTKMYLKKLWAILYSIASLYYLVVCKRNIATHKCILGR